MRTRTKVALAAAGLAVVGTAGAGAALAAAEDDQPITGDALERASRAALAHVGAGRVTDTEVGDEEGAYEVEVTREDGREVDVHLAEDFSVLDSEVEDPQEQDDADATE